MILSIARRIRVPLGSFDRFGGRIWVVLVLWIPLSGMHLVVC